MKVAAAVAGAADGAGRLSEHHHDADDDAAAAAAAGDDGDQRRQQQLLKPGSLRSSTSSVNDDSGAYSSAASPLALSLLGRAQRLFSEPPSWLPMLVLLHNQFIFAGMHVIAKPALHYIPPFALAMMRISMATPFLFLVAWRERSLPKLTKWRELPFLLLLATVGVALPQTLIFVANQLAGPSIIAILSPAAPVWAALLATSLKLERNTWVKVGGILLAVSGAFVVLRPDKMNFGQPSDLAAGCFIMLIQTMSYAAFLVALKVRLASRPYPFGIYAYASLLGVCLIAAFSAATGVAAFDVAAVPKAAWAAVVYCGLVVSFYAHAWNAWAVGKTSASIPALFSCLSPFLTGLLSYLVLGDTIGSASDIIGLALNVTGLLAVIYSKLRLETSPLQGGGSGGSSTVQPMPAGAGGEEGEEEGDGDEQLAVAAAPPPTAVPAWMPGKLTTVPEEREAAASAPPSPVAARVSSSS